MRSRLMIYLLLRLMTTVDLWRSLLGQKSLIMTLNTIDLLTAPRFLALNFAVLYPWMNILL